MSSRVAQPSAGTLTWGLVITGLGIVGIALAAGTPWVPIGGLLVFVGFVRVVIGVNQLATNIDLIAGTVVGLGETPPRR